MCPLGTKRIPQVRMLSSKHHDILLVTFRTAEVLDALFNLDKARLLDQMATLLVSSKEHGMSLVVIFALLCWSSSLQVNY